MLIRRLGKLPVCFAPKCSCFLPPSDGSRSVDDHPPQYYSPHLSRRVMLHLEGRRIRVGRGGKSTLRLVARRVDARCGYVSTEVTFISAKRSTKYGPRRTRPVIGSGCSIDPSAIRLLPRRRLSTLFHTWTRVDSATPGNFGGRRSAANAGTQTNPSTVTVASDVASSSGTHDPGCPIRCR